MYLRVYLLDYCVILLLLHCIAFLKSFFLILAVLSFLPSGRINVFNNNIIIMTPLRHRLYNFRGCGETGLDCSLYLAYLLVTI